MWEWNHPKPSLFEAGDHRQKKWRSQIAYLPIESCLLVSSSSQWVHGFGNNLCQRRHHAEWSLVRQFCRINVPFSAHLFEFLNIRHIPDLISWVHLLIRASTFRFVGRARRFRFGCDRKVLLLECLVLVAERFAHIK